MERTRQSDGAPGELWVTEEHLSLGRVRVWVEFTPVVYPEPGRVKLWGERQGRTWALAEGLVWIVGPGAEWWVAASVIEQAIERAAQREERHWIPALRALWEKAREAFGPSQTYSSAPDSSAGFLNILHVVTASDNTLPLSTDLPPSDLGYPGAEPLPPAEWWPAPEEEPLNWHEQNRRINDLLMRGKTLPAQAE